MPFINPSSHMLFYLCLYLLKLAQLEFPLVLKAHAFASSRNHSSSFFTPNTLMALGSIALGLGSWFPLFHSRLGWAKCVQGQICFVINNRFHTNTHTHTPKSRFSTNRTGNLFLQSNGKLNKKKTIKIRQERCAQKYISRKRSGFLVILEEETIRDEDRI